jgi:hypothetical protein
MSVARSPSIRAQLAPPAPAMSMAAAPMSISRRAVAAERARAGLLDHDGRVQPADQGLERGAHAPPVAVALGLAGLLQGVQVDDEGVGADHGHGAPRLVDAEAAGQLGRADIGENRRVGRPVSRREASRPPTFRPRLPAPRVWEPTARAMPRCWAASARRALMAPARAGPPVMALIRRGALSRAPQEVGAEVDLGVVQIREGLMDEAHLHRSRRHRAWRPAPDRTTSRCWSFRPRIGLSSLIGPS